MSVSNNMSLNKQSCHANTIKIEKSANFPMLIDGDLGKTWHQLTIVSNVQTLKFLVFIHSFLRSLFWYAIQWDWVEYIFSQVLDSAIPDGTIRHQSETEN